MWVEVRDDENNGVHDEKNVRHKLILGKLKLNILVHVKFCILLHDFSHTSSRSQFVGHELNAGYFDWLPQKIFVLVAAQNYSVKIVILLFYLIILNLIT